MKRLKISYFNFSVILSLLIILSICSSDMIAISHEGQVNKKLTLEEAEEIIDIFLNNPTAENFKIIKETIYPILSRDDPENISLVNKLLFYCVLEGERSWIIEYEIFTGNRFMALFARKLLDFSDGAITEALLGIFGELVRLNPELYLTIFKEDINKSVGTGTEPFFLLTSVKKPIFLGGTDKYQKYERYDLIKRIEALKSVTDPELRRVRDYCIRILENEL